MNVAIQIQNKLSSKQWWKPQIITTNNMFISNLSSQSKDIKIEYQWENRQWQSTKQKRLTVKMPQPTGLPNQQYNEVPYSFRSLGPAFGSESELFTPAPCPGKVVENLNVVQPDYAFV